MTALIFDLDGTLLDTLEDLLSATNYALSANGFPKRTKEQLRRSVGNGAANQIRTSLPEHTPEQTVRKVLSEYLPYYESHCRVCTAPYPGIPEALTELKKHYALAIVSNKPDPAVKRLCAHFFPGILALGQTEDCPRKPAPHMVEKAMRLLSARRGIYIGDSEVDILTGRNAGIPCVSVTWGFREEADLLAAGAACLCRCPEDVSGCIERMEREFYGQ